MVTLADRPTIERLIFRELIDSRQGSVALFEDAEVDRCIYHWPKGRATRCYFSCTLQRSNVTSLLAEIRARSFGTISFIPIPE